MNRRTFISRLLGGAALLALNPISLVKSTAEAATAKIQSVWNWNTTDGKWHHIAVTRRTYPRFMETYWMDGDAVKHSRVPIKFFHHERDVHTVKVGPMSYVGKGWKQDNDITVQEWDFGNEDFTIDFWAHDLHVDSLRFRQGTHILGNVGPEPIRAMGFDLREGTSYTLGMVVPK